MMTVQSGVFLKIGSGTGLRGLPQNIFHIYIFVLKVQRDFRAVSWRKLSLLHMVIPVHMI